MEENSDEERDLNDQERKQYNDKHLVRRGKRTSIANSLEDQMNIVPDGFK